MKIRISRKSTLDLNRFATFVLTVFSIILAIWLLISYAEIMIHADDALNGSHYDYSNSSNIIVELINWGKKLFN